MKNHLFEGLLWALSFYIICLSKIVDKFEQMFYSKKKEIRTFVLREGEGDEENEKDRKRRISDNGVVSDMDYDILQRGDRYEPERFEHTGAGRIL